MALHLTVSGADAGRRIDRWLQSRLDVPGGLVQRLLRQKKIRVNDLRVRDGAHRLGAGDTVVVHHDLQAPSIETREASDRRYRGPRPEVLQRANDFLLVSKPAGVACSDDGNDDHALSLWLEEFLGDEIRRGEVRPEPCHRLDRDTTGIVAIALTATAFDAFRCGLESGRVQKRYEVAVWGRPRWDELVCTTPLRKLARAARNEPRVVEARDGDEESQNAETRFAVLRRGGGCALLSAIPVTGRTHQIRAHCFALGLPVIGDRRYGNPTRDEEERVTIEHQLLRSVALQLEGENGFAVESPWNGLELEELQRRGLTG